MKTSRPHLVLLSLLLLPLTIFAAACQRAFQRNTLKIEIARGPTHISVGHTARLTARQEYREQSNDVDAVSAAPAADSRSFRAEVPARWSVSDESLAKISEDGTLLALKPGRVTIKSRWENFEASTTVEVVENLPIDSLPQFSSRGTQCTARRVSLSLEADGIINFELDFEEEGNCRELKLSAAAPAHRLPWEFAQSTARLELTSAHGPVMSGKALLSGGGEISFTAWAAGEGALPLSLSGKTVLLVGDSMAEGLGPHLQRKVEAAGGRFIHGQERSSTIVWWHGSGRLRELLGKYRPDVVFIALGSNELFVKQPELRAPLIREMVAALGERPAFWIGPPSWKPDGGLLRVIDENFQPRHFYDSAGLKVSRAPDGKHPTAQGFQSWTELVWSWYTRAL